MLKIGDFGLAKCFGSPNRLYTFQVVTRWYRAPELLFGSQMYGTGVDIWAVGCIFAELLLRAPFLPGESDLDQLNKIFTTLGSPTEENWPGHKTLQHYVSFKPEPGIPLKDIFTAAGDDLIQVLSSMLALCPAKRCTATSALKMPYFSNKPAPSAPANLPRSESAKEQKPTVHVKRMSPSKTSATAKKLRFDD